MGYQKGLPWRSFKLLALAYFSFIFTSSYVFAYHVSADLLELSHHHELIAQVEIIGPSSSEWAASGHAQTLWPVSINKIYKGERKSFFQKNAVYYIITKGGSPVNPPSTEAIKNRPLLKKCKEEACGEMIFNSGTSVLNTIYFRKNSFIVFLQKNGEVLNQQSIVEIRDGSIDSTLMPETSIISQGLTIGSGEKKTLTHKDFENLIRVAISQKHDEKNCRFTGHKHE